MRVLAISAHPDDETIGAGGTLLRHIAEGDEVHWAVCTQPHEPTWSAEDIAQAVIMAMTNGYLTGAVLDVDGGHLVRG